MSWLVAVCFPGLLMVGAVGLQRLESELHGDRPTAADFVARIEKLARTARDAARDAARDHTGPLPLKALPRPIGHQPPARNAFADEPGLPTRLRAYPPPNPQYQAAGYANPV